MKFNKFFLALALLLALTLGASAQGFVSQSFLNGFNLQVVPTSTNNYAATNGYAKGFTVTNSGTYPYVSSISPTYQTNANAISDVPLWADRDGSSPSANISVHLYGINAAFTNTATFRFATVPAQPNSDSLAYPPGYFGAATAAQNLFAFAVTGNGTNDVIVATNLPTGFLQGNKAIRLLAVEWTNAGTNGYVKGVFVNGFKPTP